MRISVIMPVYNVEKQLPRCIESIIFQTYTDYELLLIDDGSTDRSGKICDDYARTNKQIKVYHKKNGGVSSARNFGIENASGTEIVFIDSDDWVEKDYLANFSGYKIDDGTLVVQGRIDEGIASCQKRGFEKTTLSKGKISQGIIDNQLLEFGAPYCKLYIKSVIINNNIRFPENYSYGEDAMFFYQYLQYVDKVILSSYCGYHYVNSGDNSLSRKYHKYNHLLQFAIDSVNAIAILDDKLDAKSELKKYFQTNYLNLIKKAIIGEYKGGSNYSEKIQFFKDLSSLQKQVDGILGDIPKGFFYRNISPVLLSFFYSVVFKIKK